MNNISNIVFKKLVDTKEKTIVEQITEIQENNTILTQVPFQDGLLISYADLSKIGQPQDSKEAEKLAKNNDYSMDKMKKKD